MWRTSEGRIVDANRFKEIGGPRVAFDRLQNHGLPFLADRNRGVAKAEFVRQIHGLASVN